MSDIQKNSSTTINSIAPTLDKSLQTNHLCSLLDTWFSQKDELDWVIGTVIETDGSSYRKPGAMMFINSLGQYFGLLSGGCLEADIMRQARKCLDTGRNQIIQYDMRDEDDLAWKLGIGCGGLVRILLQPLSEENGYLQLPDLRDRLHNNQTCFYVQQVNEAAPENLCFSANDDNWKINALNQKNADVLFVSEQKPVFRLGVFGGGIDARPLVSMAKTIGWHVTLYDERLGYAKPGFFPTVDAVVRDKYDDLSGHKSLQQLSAIVLMNHNIVLDAKSLLLAQASSASYVGMLGPDHRTERVFNEMQQLDNINPVSDRVKALHNPIGLALGGELPESIALSMLAEIHAFLHKSDARSFSNWAQLSQ